MTHYALAPLAESDLDDIWLYIAREAGSDTADRLFDALIRRVLMLAVHPQAGRARPDIADNVRSFPVGSFVIYYRATPAGVMIARVLHGSRDPESARIV
jgi:toxin ParE1/3/4